MQQNFKGHLRTVKCVFMVSLQNETCHNWVLIWLIECFTTTFLHTHHSLLAKLGWWGCLTRMRLARYQKDYIEIKSETPGVWAKDLIPNFAITLPLLETADSRKCMRITPEGTWRGGGGGGCSKFLNLNWWKGH